ncbi:MAG: radical SAM protein [Sulfolobales archaeon]|nr:radical SAM protein [Sulfolobales archaeon]MCX8209124.1 radical SAM protein [Sulfolobales archaeon]
MLIRASIGTLAAVGIANVKVLAEPGVAYLLQYSEEGCLAECHFCSQSSKSRASKDLLSRVVWPVVELENVAPKLAEKFERTCVQSVIKPHFVEELHQIVKTLSHYGLKISLSTTPIPSSDLRTFKSEGVDFLGVGLDAATPEVARKVGKPYPYEAYLDFVEKAVEVFGRGRVVVHLVVGLGESIRDAVETIAKIHALGARVSLFAFTPVGGTPMERWPRPPLRYYRVLQIANYLLSNGAPTESIVDIDRVCVRSSVGEGLEVLRTLSMALLTSGCPSCNRPYYTESPRGELYNYPLAAQLPPVEELLRELSCDIS